MSPKVDDECIFCMIVARKVPAHILLEDDKTISFLDKYPQVPGHTLVIPKEHHVHFQDMAPEEAADLFSMVNIMNKVVMGSMDAPGSTIGLNNGKAGGQFVPHVHAHIMPRFPEDGGGSLHTLFERGAITDDEMKELAEKLRAAVADLERG